MSDNDDLFKRSVIASADTTFLMNSDGAVTLDGEGVKTVSNLDIDHVAFAVRCNKEAADGAVNGMEKGFKVLSKVFVKFPDDAARTALFEDEARSIFANSINPDIPQDVLHLNLGVWYEQQTKQGPTHKHFNATKGLGHSIMIPTPFNLGDNLNIYIFKKGVWGDDDKRLLYCCYVAASIYTLKSTNASYNRTTISRLVTALDEWHIISAGRDTNTLFGKTMHPPQILPSEELTIPHGRSVVMRAVDLYVNLAFKQECAVVLQSFGQKCASRKGDNRFGYLGCRFRLQD